jgi:hypothetical protein
MASDYIFGIFKLFLVFITIIKCDPTGDEQFSELVEQFSADKVDNLAVDHRTI